MTKYGLCIDSICFIRKREFLCWGTIKQRKEQPTRFCIPSAVGRRRGFDGSRSVGVDSLQTGGRKPRQAFVVAVVAPLLIVVIRRHGSESAITTGSLFAPLDTIIRLLRSWVTCTAPGP
jgi:hypothetical protein